MKQEKRPRWFWGLKAMLLVSVLIVVSCQAPAPVSLYLLVDTSASFAKQRELALQSAEKLIQRLDPGLDYVYLFRLDRRGAVLISEGHPPRFTALKQVLNQHAQTANDQFKGTPYAQALDRIASLIPPNQAASIVILGDLADEKVSGQAAQPLDSKYLDRWSAKLPPQSHLAMIGIDPRFEQILDPIRRRFHGRLTVVTAAEESNSQKGVVALLQAIGR